jgi:Tol biopolymer transport system component
MESMDSSLPPIFSAPALKKSHRHLYFYLAASLLVAAAVLQCLDYQYWHHLPFNKSVTGYYGKLYFSLAPEGSNNADAYTYNLRTGKISLIAENQYYKVTPNISTDGKTLVYIGREKNDTVYQRNVYIAKSNGESVQKITSSNHFNALRPVFSRDNSMIAFAGTSTANVKSLNEWNIFVTDLQGKEMKVYVGSSPQWLPDGKLVGILSDGIYTFDIATKGVQKIWQFRQAPHAYSKIAVSPDGMHLALIGAVYNQVFLFNLSEGPQLIKLEKTIPSNSTAGAFSADSKYLALQETTYSKAGAVESNALSIYSLESDTKSMLNDGIDMYNDDVTFLSGWGK